MQLRPSIVIGLGSTGKHVLSNIQRFLYEVLNTESLDIFRFLVIETDTNNLVDGGRAGMISIHEQDTGHVYRAMRAVVGDDWNWCPQALRLDGGPGAGNMRAGGRMMFLYNYAKVQGAISRAITEVTRSAGTNQTRQHLARIKPGTDIPENLIDNPGEVVVYVVGSLTGGTCSGACIDLGYQIRRFHPNAKRIGIFTIPDRQSSATFKANAWAAIADLQYFSHHKEDYQVSWRDAGEQRASIDGASVGAAPYDRVYLLSPRDKTGNLQLPFAPAPSSPLLVMMGLQVAADLLGMYTLRSARLVDMPQHVNNGLPDPSINLFMNFNLRAVSYPKYELSEAAACKLISDTICENWLSESAYSIRGEKPSIKEESLKQEGRTAWNELAPNILRGLRADVNIERIVEAITRKDVHEPREYVNSQFCSGSAGTVYSLVKQHESDRVAALKNEIIARFVKTLAESGNLKVAELFLIGIREEIARTTNYWRQLDIPTDGDRTAWATHVGERITRMSGERRSGFIVPLLLKPDVLEDGLNDLLRRLEMFVMAKALKDVIGYIDSELQERLRRMRSVIGEARQASLNRLKTLVEILQDASGPILKIPRFQNQGFDKEIEELAAVSPEIHPDEQIRLQAGNLEGLFAISLRPRNNEVGELFNTVKMRIQPDLLRRLGPVDVVQRASDGGMLHLAAQRAMVAHELSLPVNRQLVTGPNGVPMLMTAKTQMEADALKRALSQVQQNMPDYQPVETPLLDHIAIFYQEGAGIIPEEVMSDAPEFEAEYRKIAQVRPEIIDPLRLLKGKPIEHITAAAPNTTLTGGGNSSSTTGGRQ
jgi:hypothetical protein